MIRPELGRLIAAAAAGWMMVTTAVPTAWAATPAVPDPSQVSCAGLELAPFLDSERGSDGSRLTFVPDARGRFVPVIVIHGWVGTSRHNPSSGAFSKNIDLTERVGNRVDVGRSLIGQLQSLRGAAVFTFDYQEYSARWVTDEHLGPALGAAIDCLYQVSGERVIVVAHSMGGLVTRWAVSQRDPAGLDRARKVSTVVTFGTPEQGSVAATLLAIGLDVAAVTDRTGIAAVLRIVLAACGQASSTALTTGSLCDFLPTYVKAFDSAAGRGLQAGSAELRSLPPFPPGLRVVALAGDTHLSLPDISWFGARPWPNDASIGDVIVDRDSALAGADKSFDASCTYQLDAVEAVGDQIGMWLQQKTSGEVAQPIWEVAGPCFHTNLMREVGLTIEAIGAVNDDIAGRNGPPTFNLDGWGRITIGMTRAEAEAAAPFPLAPYGGNHNCTWLVDKRVLDGGDLVATPQVTIDASGHVITINAYAIGTARTDRGIKAGSSRADIRAAYPEPKTEIDTQAGRTLVVTGPNGHDLSFSFDDAGRVNGVGVGSTGYAIGFELCSGG